MFLECFAVYKCFMYVHVCDSILEIEVKFNLPLIYIEFPETIVYEKYLQ